MPEEVQRSGRQITALHAAVMPFSFKKNLNQVIPVTSCTSLRTSSLTCTPTSPRLSSTLHSPLSQPPSSHPPLTHRLPVKRNVQTMNSSINTTEPNVNSDADVEQFTDDGVCDADDELDEECLGQATDASDECIAVDPNLYDEDLVYEYDSLLATNKAQSILIRELLLQIKQLNLANLQLQYVIAEAKPNLQSADFSADSVQELSLPMQNASTRGIR